MKKKNLTADEGRAMGRRYLTSGKTRSEFAKEAGVTKPMVQYWAEKVRREERFSVQGLLEESTSAFIQVTAEEAESAQGEGGATLEMQFGRMHFETVPAAEYVARLAIEMARRT